MFYRSVVAGLSNTEAIRNVYMTEWLTLAMLPLHPNINRFLGEFVVDVPDAMFEALTPDLKELGTPLRRALCFPPWECRRWWLRGQGQGC
jgi:hypothetical protein